MAKTDVTRVVAFAAISLFVIAIGYLVFTSQFASSEIPPHVTGEMREMYEWAKTPQGKVLLESLPCYCGCRYEGHLHARHCFWRDDGTFDKHGVTCSVCFDIAKKAKQHAAEGKTICEIREEIDEFYKPNAHLGTETPLPAQCAAD